MLPRGGPAAAASHGGPRLRAAGRLPVLAPCGSAAHGPHASGAASGPFAQSRRRFRFSRGRSRARRWASLGAAVARGLAPGLPGLAGARRRRAGRRQAAAVATARRHPGPRRSVGRAEPRPARSRVTRCFTHRAGRDSGRRPTWAPAHDRPTVQTSSDAVHADLPVLGTGLRHVGRRASGGPSLGASRAPCCGGASRQPSARPSRSGAARRPARGAGAALRSRPPHSGARPAPPPLSGAGRAPACRSPVLRDISEVRCQAAAERRWNARVRCRAGRLQAVVSWPRNLLNRCRWAWRFQSPAARRASKWRRAPGRAAQRGKRPDRPDRSEPPVLDMPVCHNDFLAAGAGDRADPAKAFNPRASAKRVRSSPISASTRAPAKFPSPGKLVMIVGVRVLLKMGDRRHGQLLDGRTGGLELAQQRPQLNTHRVFHYRRLMQVGVGEHRRAAARRRGRGHGGGRP